MPQGNSAVRPTNGLYLYLLTFKSCFVSTDRLLSSIFLTVWSFKFS